MHLVDEPHDRCVVDVGPVAGIGFLLVVAAAQLEIFHLEVVAGELRHRGVDLLQRAAEQPIELVFLDDDRLDGQAGRELDLVQRVQVRRVGYANEQLLAALHQRQDAVLAQDLLADDADRLEVGLDGIEIEQRGAELLRRGDGDLAGTGEVVLDQVADDTDAAFPGVRQRVRHGAFRNEPVVHESLRQALQSGSLCGGGRNPNVIHGLGRRAHRFDGVLIMPQA